MSSFSPPSPPSLPSPWVLVIDPSLTLCRVLELELIQAGWQTRTFQRPLEALQYLHQQVATPPVALILDIDLPQMDGLAVTHLVRTDASEALRVLPILALTSRDRVLDRVQAKLVGINASLIKPFRVQDLIERLQHLLSIPPDRPGPLPDPPEDGDGAAR